MNSTKHDEMYVAEHLHPSRQSRRGVIIVACAILVLAAGIYAGIHERLDAEATLTTATEEAAIPTVNVINPTAGAPNEELVLPGNVQAFTDTAIYARTNGYLKSWNFDIGARVKQGDLLAEIDTPEVDSQLQMARADLSVAEANMKLAESTANRDRSLFKTQTVSAQQRDNSDAAAAAGKATVASKQADVSRLERLQSYEKVIAPFDGIITARNTDVGALINAGASAPAQELFHLAAIDKVRVFVSVPEAYVRTVHLGDNAVITLAEFPKNKFNGTLVRTSNSIDATSRTLLVEIDVDNPDGHLLPGAYASAHLTLAGEEQSVTIPSNTVIFRKEGPSVAVVRNGQAQMVKIAIGRDYGDKLEIVSGLAPEDAVIIDPSDSLIDGTPVHVGSSSVVSSSEQE